MEVSTWKVGSWVGAFDCLFVPKSRFHIGGLSRGILIHCNDSNFFKISIVIRASALFNPMFAHSPILLFHFYGLWGERSFELFFVDLRIFDLFSMWGDIFTHDRIWERRAYYTLLWDLRRMTLGPFYKVGSNSRLDICAWGIWQTFDKQEYDSFSI